MKTSVPAPNAKAQATITLSLHPEDVKWLRKQSYHLEDCYGRNLPGYPVSAVDWEESGVAPYVGHAILAMHGGLTATRRRLAAT